MIGVLTMILAEPDSKQGEEIQALKQKISELESEVQLVYKKFTVPKVKSLEAQFEIVRKRDSESSAKIRVLQEELSRLQDSCKESIDSPQFL